MKGGGDDVLGQKNTGQNAQDMVVDWTFRMKEGKMVTQISVLYRSVHGGERKKHTKRTKALLHPTLPHKRRKQDDKMICVQFEEISNRQSQSSKMSGLETHTCESPFVDDDGSHGYGWNY